MQDKPRFKAAFEQVQAKGWCFYFPFLYFWSLSGSRELLIEEYQGALCVYLLRGFNKDKRPELNLFFPPMPFNKDALNYALGRLKRYKNSGTNKILWVDQDTIAQIRANREFDQLSFQERDNEYIYQTKAYTNIELGKFKYLRQQINRAKRIPNLKVENYQLSYKKECLRLLAEWEIKQSEKYRNIDDITFTKNCLKNADTFKAPDLSGLVIFIDDEIKAFGFIGHSYSNFGNAFIAKSDHSYSGLNLYLNYLLLTKFDSDIFINAGPDLGNPGLKYNKEKLLPIMKHKVFKANINAKAKSRENVIDDLKEISIFDKEKYYLALEKSSQRSFMNFFPFLLALNASASRSILIGYEKNALCIYFLHESSGQQRLHLYLPPMPYSTGSLQQSLKRINAFNDNQEGKILWVNKSAREEIETSSDFHFSQVEEEFIFSPTSYQLYF